MSGKLPLRVAQLDLARQMENFAYITSFIDFIAANGYNALALYLEARIRTAGLQFDFHDAVYIPEAILNCRGRVENPENLLENDDQWCFIGDRDTRDSFLEPSRAAYVHRLEVKLRRA